MTTFAVAWILAITLCPDHRCRTIEAPMPSLYLCETRARDVVELAQPAKKVTADCRTIRGDKLGL